MSKERGERSYFVQGFIDLFDDPDELVERVRNILPEGMRRKAPEIAQAIRERFGIPSEPLDPADQDPEPSSGSVP